MDNPNPARGRARGRARQVRDQARRPGEETTTPVSFNF